MKAAPSALLALAVFIAAACAELPADSKRSGHAEFAHKARAAELKREEHSENHTLHKRFGPGRMTFYDVGLGACGWWNNANDYIVAVNSAQFGGYAVYPPAICGKQITISYKGKQAGAVVADECPTCGYGELDLSRGLFNNFAGENDGVFFAEWWFNDGNSNPQPQPQPTTAQAPSPTTTEQPQPQPTTPKEEYSTPQPQPTTTTTSQQQAPPPTTSSSSSAPSSSSRPASSSVPTYQSASVASASHSSSAHPPPPSSTPETATTQNIQDMCSVIVQFGQLISQAAGRDLSLSTN